MKLNRASTNEIVQILESGPFSLEDFRLSFESHDLTLFDVTFIPDQNFRFWVKTEEDSSYKIVAQPGEIYSMSIEYVDDFESIIDHLHGWVRRIMDELKADEIDFESMEETRKKIEKELENFGGNLEGRLTADELKSVLANLDELSMKFEELHEAQKLSQSEVEFLRKEIADLRDNASVLKKGILLQTTLTRVKKWSRKIPPEVAKQLIIESAKILILGNNS